MAIHAPPPPRLPPLELSSSFYPSNPSSSINPTSSPSATRNRPLPKIPQSSQSPQSSHLDRGPEPATLRPVFPRQHKLSFDSASVASSTSTSRGQGCQSSRSRVLSSFMPHSTRSSLSLLSTIQIPSVLAAIIAHLDWTDALGLLNTCRTTRRLFLNDNPQSRDVILARFVPGYAHCLRARDLQPLQDIPVSLHDLDLLLISQKVPLHKYPTHALKALSALYPSFEDDELSEKLVTLTQAHSRFVLLLQSLVHSSSAPIPVEQEDIRNPFPVSSTGNLRELTFPAPLSFSHPHAPVESETSAIVSGKHHHRKSTVLKHKSAPSHQSAEHALFLLKTHASRPSADSASSMFSRNDERQFPLNGRRLSIFGKKMSEPPPRLDEPRSLKYYSSSWRRTLDRSDSNAPTAWAADDDGVLRKPHRRFASMNNHSSDSSISENHSPSPLSSRSGSDSGTRRRPGVSPTPPRMTSPHDLSLATWRIRAPVLRVFVPCTKLEEGQESLELCEQQLADADLWDYLSTGDVVCNLGYVPNTTEEGTDTPGSVVVNNARKWLLFNGSVLVPYSPPDILPLDQPLSLPSPFYYGHIMPAFASPTFIITQFPVCDDIPQLAIVNVTSKVKSPHSPSGYAVVKRYAWTARVVRTRHSEEGVGEGWSGEWILEGQGTEEGRKELLDALAGAPMGKRKWEVVREQSGGGKVWLRLLH